MIVDSLVEKDRSSRSSTPTTTAQPAKRQKGLYNIQYQLCDMYITTTFEIENKLKET